DRAELAAVLDGGLGLEVVHVHVRRAAGQVDHDGGLAGAARPAIAGPRGRSTGAEHVGQCQAGPEGPDLEEAAASDAVAEPLLVAPERKHEKSPLFLKHGTSRAMGLMVTCDGESGNDNLGVV